MLLRSVICILMSLQMSLAYAAGDYVDRPEVDSYIDSLVADYDFSRQALEEIFLQAEK